MTHGTKTVIPLHIVWKGATEYAAAQRIQSEGGRKLRRISASRFSLKFTENGLFLLYSTVLHKSSCEIIKKIPVTFIYRWDGF